jgi:hypothetical protein
VSLGMCCMFRANTVSSGVNSRLSFFNLRKGKDVLYSCQRQDPIPLRTYSQVSKYIPRGASRGAATPTGALLRKDIASRILVAS